MKSSPRLAPVLVSIVVFLAGRLPGQSPAGPPTVWPPSAGGNGHVYQVWLWGAGWTASNTFATSVPGRYLATVTSANENAFIFSLLNAAPAVWGPCAGCNPIGPWIGGTYVGGAWTWATTGEPFCYANWAPLEPANGCPGGPFENCIHYHSPPGGIYPSDRWNDLPSIGCPGNALLPIGFVTELQAFDLTVSQPFPGGLVTIADTGGVPGAFVYNAFTLTVDPCRDGWFFGLNMGAELAGELAGFPFAAPFSSPLDAAGGFTFVLGLGPGIPFDYIGVMIAPVMPYAVIAVSRPKTYVTI